MTLQIALQVTKQHAIENSLGLWLAKVDNKLKYTEVIMENIINKLQMQEI